MHSFSPTCLARLSVLALAAALTACSTTKAPKVEDPTQAPDMASTRLVVNRMYARYAESANQALQEIARAHQGAAAPIVPETAPAPAPAVNPIIGTGLDKVLTLTPYTGDVEDLVYVIASRMDWKVLSPVGIRVAPVQVTYAANNKHAITILRELGAAIGRSAEIMADMQNKTLQVHYPVNNAYDPTDVQARKPSRRATATPPASPPQVASGESLAAHEMLLVDPTPPQKPKPRRKPKKPAPKSTEAAPSTTPATETSASIAAPEQAPAQDAPKPEGANTETSSPSSATSPEGKSSKEAPSETPSGKAPSKEASPGAEKARTETEVPTNASRPDTDSPQAQGSRP